MTDAFTDLIDSVVDIMGSTATYRYKHGDVKSIKAVLDNELNPGPDAFESQVPDRQLVVHLKAADIERPISGETISIGDDTYTVQRILEHNAYAIKVAVI